MGRAVRVKCFETGEIYQNMTSAAMAANTSVAGVSTSARKGTTAGGYHWIRLDNGGATPRPKKFRVRCIETGKVYGSITEAARATGINRSNIGSAATGRAGGLTWECV